MNHMTTINRRALGRSLSRITNASVAEALDGLVDARDTDARRIGFTGAPGAGKSTLISRYAKYRLDQSNNVGVLMIDPTSPISGGAVLGDRIRMDAIADDPGLFIRSVPSRSAHDGLCDNAPDLMLAMEQHGFDEVILETVGVGQVEYAVKMLVDTVVLVLMPESGDTIQAMKAGILENADIIVINKADLPGAERSRSEISAILKRRLQSESYWCPEVVMSSTKDNQGLADLAAAIDRHRAWLAANENRADMLVQRRQYHLQSLLSRRAQEVMAATDADKLRGDLRQAFDHLAHGIGALDQAD